MKAILFTLILLCTLYGSAQTISTEAPSISASAVVVPRKSFQIESSLAIYRTGNSSFSPTVYDLPFNLFRVGITDRFELRMTNGVQLQRYQGNSSLRFNEIELGAKYQFFKDKEKSTQLALIAHGRIPYYESERYAFNTILAFSQSIKNTHTIGFNANYAYNKYGNQSTSLYHMANFSLIYSNQITNRLSAFGEIYTNTTFDHDVINDETNFSFDFGFVFLLKDHIQIDYVFGRGINHYQNYHSLGFNILLGNK